MNADPTDCKAATSLHLPSRSISSGLLPSISARFIHAFRRRASLLRFLAFALLSIFFGGHAHANFAIQSFLATNGTYSDKVVLAGTITVNECAGSLPVTLTISRDGGPITTFTAGTSWSYDDTGAHPGVTHSYMLSLHSPTAGPCTGQIGDNSSTTGRRSLILSPVTGFTASDGLSPTFVRMNFTAPNVTASGCTRVSYLLRDNGTPWAVLASTDGGGGALTSVPATGGAVQVDYVTSNTGVRTYQVDSVCTPGNAAVTGPSDTGSLYAPTPFAATAVTASDGTFSDRVRISWAAPDQSSQCTAISYVITRGGVDLATSTFTTLTGGAASYDDLTAPIGTLTYGVRAVCTPGSQTVSSSTDTGYKVLGSPWQATGVTATRGAYADRVVVTFNTLNQAPVCEFIEYRIIRNGVDIGASSYNLLAAGSGTYVDTTAVFGISYPYQVRSVCNPGATTATSSSASGMAGGGVPFAVPALSASDGTYSDRVRVSFTAPDQTPRFCTSATYTVERNGSSVGTYTDTGALGGAFFYDDMAPPLGNHTYGITVRCVPGNQLAGSPTDVGYRVAVPSAPTGVSASDGTFSDRVTVSFTAPNQSASCSAISYVVVRDGGDIGTSAFTTITGGSASFDDTSATPGQSYSYTVRAVCSPGGGTITSAADTGFRAGMPSPATAVSATDGLFSNKSSVTWTAPDQSSTCASASYVVTRDGVDQATISTIPLSGGAGVYDDTTLSAGLHTYGVRSVCSPGGLTAVSPTDTGYKLGTPAAVSALAATDGTFTLKVNVTWVAPDQSSACTSASYVVIRDGSDIGTVSTIPLTGGAGLYQDASVGPGVHTYSVRSVCDPGSQVAVSSTDTGFKSGSPVAAVAVSATDGVYSNKVTISWTAPDQTAECTSAEYVVTRDGADLATITTIPVTGGSGTFDDTAVPPGLHSYGVRASCIPGAAWVNSATDSGYKLGTPLAATAVLASDGAFATKVAITWNAPDQSSACSSVSYVVVRDAIDLSTVTTVPLTGGLGAFDDTTVSPGVHSYSVRSVCTPGSQQTSSLSDNGYKSVTPASATAVLATDGAFPNRVAVSWTAPDQTANCSSVSYVVTRDGVDQSTITTIPLTGGAGSYDDVTVSAGTYTYGVRSVCTPGAATAASSTDTGYKLGTPIAPSAVAATDGTFSNKVSVTWTAPDQSAACSSVVYVVSRDGADQGSVGTVPLSGGPGTFDDTTVGSGTHTYVVRSVCTPGSQTSSSSSDTGYKLGAPAAATSVVASDGAFPNKVTVTWVGPDQTANCSSISYIVTRDGADQTTDTTIPLSGGAGTYDDTTVSAGLHTYGIRAVCTPGAQTSTSTSDTGYKLGTPLPASAVSATDGAFATKVDVTWSSPDQSAYCSSTSYVVSRDGSDIGTVTTIPVTGGAGAFSDTTLTAGPHTYAVRSVCLPGNQTAASGTDTGYKLGSPAAPTALNASDYTISDRVTISVTLANDSAQCVTRDVIIARDGTDITTISTIPVSGGSASFDDLAPSFGVHTYSARSVCSPGLGVSASTTDTGGRRGLANAPTGISATDYTLADRVSVTVTAANDAAECTSRDVVIARDGTDIATVTTIPVAGGSSTFQDMFPTFGAHTYTARSVCNPGATPTTTVSDVGGRLAVASPPASLSATDYTLIDRVTLTVTAANDSAQCTSRDVILARDGGDIATISTIAASGGSASFDDFAAAPGLHTYTARSVCSPGGQQSASVSDPGAKRFPAPTCGVFDSATPTIVNLAGAQMGLTARGVANASLIRFSAYGNVGGASDTSYYASSQAGSDYTGSVLISNHAGETGTFTASLLLTGSNPGDPEVVCSTTTFTVIAACGPMTLSGPQGTGTLPATITWTADTAATQYVIEESTSAVGPFSPISTVPAGTTTLSVPGWPKMYYRVMCDSADPSGDSTSPAVQVWGSTVPVVTPQVFFAGNPGTTVVTPVVVDADGNTTFTLSVPVQPANGVVAIVGSTFTYTPNVGFSGFDPFTVVATDPGGSAGSALFTADVQTTPPPKPANVSATDGTRTTDVRVTWDPSANATSYEIYRGVSVSDPSPVLVGATPLTTFDDVSATPSQVGFFTVKAYNGTSASPVSAADSGFRDTPPSGLSASASTLFNVAVDLPPVITDPDPGEAFTLSVLAQPGDGLATVAGSVFHYVPSGTFTGVQTFPIRIADRAGATTDGIATVTVGCAPLALQSPTVAPLTVLQNAGAQIAATYSTGFCPHPVDVSLRVLDGSTPLLTDSRLGVTPGNGLRVAFDIVATVAPGTYVAELTITNRTTLESVTKTSTLRVVPFQPPTFSWNQSTVIAGAEVATLGMRATAQCVATTNDAEALADHSRCLLEPTNLPPGVANTVPSFNVAWSVMPSAAGSYPTSVAVSQYDAGNNKRLLASVDVPVNVVDPATLVFGSAPVTARQFIDVYTMSLAQSSGPLCRIYDTVSAAQPAVAAGQRGCVVEWTTAPVDSYIDGSTLKGAFFTTTSESASWQVSIVQLDGSKVALSSGSASATALPVDLSFQAVVSPASAYSLVTQVSVSPRNVGADSCSAITSSDAQASSSALRPCLFEWGTVSGMAQDGATTAPLFRGRLPTSPVTSIPYSLSIYFNGTKRPILSSGFDVPAEAPTPPPLSFEYVKSIDVDTYSVSTLGGSFGVLVSDTLLGSVTGQSQLAGDAAPTTISLIATKKRAVMFATPAPLYTSRSLDVSLSYVGTPALSTSKTVNIVTVPRDGLRLMLNSPPASAPDTSPLTVSATIVEPTVSGYQYIAANAGQWRVTFGQIGSNGVYTPMTSEVLTDANGVASATIPLTGLQILRLTARATPVSPYPAYTREILSYTSNVAVVKGTAIDGTLSVVGAASGPAPFLGVVRVAFTTRADQVANLSLTWFQSDDGGSTWFTPSTASGVQYANRFSIGSHQIKVQFVNRNTNEVSWTPPITIEAYPILDIAVSGPTYYLPGGSGTLTATATDSVTSAPVPGAVWSWSISPHTTSPQPPVATGATSVIPFSSLDSGAYRLVIRARDPSTVDGDPRAWTQVARQLIVGIPSKPTVRISGPQRLEVGVPGTYTATLSTAFNLADSSLTLGGQWTLPDGSTVPGATLSWTPSQADFDLSRSPVLSYTGWIVGYEASTTSSFTTPVQLWKYVWPTWRTTLVQSAQYAPVSNQITVIPDNPTLLGVLQGLTYSWTVPPGLTFAVTPTSKLVAVADVGGSYPVSVVVSDTRGNSTTLNVDVAVADAPPVVVDLVGTNFSKWTHSPITLGLTTKATGGNPRDAVTQWTYWVDGVQAAVPNLSSARVELPNPGTYSIEARIQTRLGATASKSITVTVPSNAAPTCAPSGVVAANRRSIAVKANCVDPDGSIVHYAWSMNGVSVPLTVGAVWTLNLPANQTWPVDLSLTVTDDGGLQSTSTVSFP